MSPVRGVFGEIVNRIAAIGETFPFFAHGRDCRVAGDDSGEAARSVCCHKLSPIDTHYPLRVAFQGSQGCCLYGHTRGRSAAGIDQPPGLLLTETSRLDTRLMRTV